MKQSGIMVFAVLFVIAFVSTASADSGRISGVAPGTPHVDAPEAAEPPSSVRAGTSGFGPWSAAIVRPAPESGLDPGSQAPAVAAAAQTSCAAASRIAGIRSAARRAMGRL